MQFCLTIFGWLLISAAVSAIITLIIIGLGRLIHRQIHKTARWVIFGVFTLLGWFTLVPLFWYIILG